MRPDYGAIVRNGIWDNNAVFAQLLALCPTLAVTGTATNGLGMGLATAVVLVATGAIVALVRRLTLREVRIPVFVLVIAACVTLVDMVMKAWLFELHSVLGLFIPLIVTNCIILGRAEAFASRNPTGPSVVDGLATGVGFILTLVVVGAVREIIGHGTLFADAHLLLGDAFAWLETVVVADYNGALVAVLPPGGFLAVGFLMAGKRVIDERLRAGAPATGPVAARAAEPAP